MLISHEVPIDLLERSKCFNDYDYCLLHLTYEHPEYREFYRNSNRRVLLDNSLFELGDALTNQQLADGVRDINPTWYVIPDCLNDKNTTIDRFESFKRDFPDLPGRAIGVAQGATVSDLVDCYVYMSMYADKIAIPFDSKAFDEYMPDEKNPLVRWCNGRQAFIKELIDRDLWDYTKPHHLLGCSFATEFGNPLYKKLKIESVDTSNPIVAAICGKEYKGTLGLSDKPSVKLCDLITTKVPRCSKLEELIDYNVEQFRRICNE